MTNLKTLLIAAPAALGLLAAPAAHAEWRGHGGWGGGGGWGHERFEHRDHGGAVAGALLGLGAAAVVGGIIASQQPPAYYAPPTYYAPPAYYATPAYYSYPSPYYAQPYYAPN